MASIEITRGSATASMSAPSNLPQAWAGGRYSRAPSMQPATRCRGAVPSLGGRTFDEARKGGEGRDRSLVSRLFEHCAGLAGKRIERQGQGLDDIGAGVDALGGGFVRWILGLQIDDDLALRLGRIGAPLRYDSDFEGLVDNDVEGFEGDAAEPGHQGLDTALELQAIQPRPDHYPGPEPLHILQIEVAGDLGADLRAGLQGQAAIRATRRGPGQESAPGPGLAHAVAHRGSPPISPRRSPAAS